MIAKQTMNAMDSVETANSQRIGDKRRQQRRSPHCQHGPVDGCCRNDDTDTGYERSKHSPFLSTERYAAAPIFLQGNHNFCSASQRLHLADRFPDHARNLSVHDTSFHTLLVQQGDFLHQIRNLLIEGTKAVPPDLTNLAIPLPEPEPSPARQSHSRSSHSTACRHYDLPRHTPPSRTQSHPHKPQNYFESSITDTRTGVVLVVSTNENGHLVSVPLPGMTPCASD